MGFKLDQDPSSHFVHGDPTSNPANKQNSTKMAKWSVSVFLKG